MINGIVIDSVRHAKSYAAVGAAYEHHIGAGIEAGWLHTGDHVNIIVSGTAGTVHCQEHLSRQAAWINCIAEIETAAKADLSDLVKSGRNVGVLRIVRAEAPKRAGKVGRAADEEIAV